MHDDGGSPSARRCCCTKFGLFLGVWPLFLLFLRARGGAVSFASGGTTPARAKREGTDAEGPGGLTTSFWRAWRRLTDGGGRGDAGISAARHKEGSEDDAPTTWPPATTVPGGLRESDGGGVAGLLVSSFWTAKSGGESAALNETRHETALVGGVAAGIMAAALCVLARRFCPKRGGGKVSTRGGGLLSVEDAPEATGGGAGTLLGHAVESMSDVPRALI